MSDTVLATLIKKCNRHVNNKMPPVMPSNIRTTAINENLLLEDRILKTQDGQ
jgi:hypothetical protein